MYACTYYRLPGDLREPMIRLNDVIREAANNTGVDCIDIEDCAISSGNPQEYFMDYDAENRAWRSCQSGRPGNYGRGYCQQFS